MQVFARKKLASRPISWAEMYTEDTAYFKVMYEDVVGSGSYFRYEGTDAETGDEYYVVIGPAKMKSPEARFFAGVRKLPSDFAAGGKYFSSIGEAFKYANETWGIHVPNSLHDYTAKDIKGLAKSMKEWRETHSKEEVAESFDKPIAEISAQPGEGSMQVAFASAVGVIVDCVSELSKLGKKAEAVEVGAKLNGLVVVSDGQLERVASAKHRPAAPPLVCPIRLRGSHDLYGLKSGGDTAVVVAFHLGTIGVVNEAGAGPVLRTLPYASLPQDIVGTKDLCELREKTQRWLGSDAVSSALIHESKGKRD